VNPALVPLEHRANVLLDGRVVISGGQNVFGAALAQVLVYDPTRHELVQAADLPGGGRVGHVTHVIDRPTSPHHGWLLCLGGTDGSVRFDDLQVLDPVSLTWTQLPVTLTHASAQGTLIGAQAVGKGSPSPSAYVAANHTVTTGPLVVEIHPSASAPYVAITNLVYRLELDPNDDGDYTDTTLIDESLRYLREVEDQCTVTHHPGTDGSYGTIDDRLVIFGGVGIEVDPVSGTSILPATTPPGETAPPPGCVLADAEVIDLGSGAVGQVTSTLRYDSYGYISLAGVWDDPSLIQRYNNGAVVLPSGRILIAGGTNAFGDVLVGSSHVSLTPNYDLDVMAGTVEPLTTQSFYLHPDPAFPDILSSWQVQLIPFPDGVLQDPRGQFTTGHLNWVTATLLTAGGDVLMAGGDDMRSLGTSTTNATERFDPITSQWSLTDTLGEARALHTLTPIPGGMVLAFGGTQSASAFTPATTYELYRP
jgi:hypothetical protein